MSHRVANRRTASWLIIVSVLALGVKVRAADDEVRLMPDSVRMKFTRADKDGDKKLTLAEFQATVTTEQTAIAKRDFELFDLNADGQLSLDEFWALPTVAPADQRGPIPDPLMGFVDQFPMVMDQFFKNWDQDPDRTIPLNTFVAEFNATVQEPNTSVLLRQADQNADQQVTRKEARRFIEIQFGVRRNDGKLLRDPGGRVAQHMQFQRADTNRDDRLDRTEFLEKAYAGEKAAEMFVNGDTNKDDFISWEEWCRMPGRMTDPINDFRRMDKNLNGKQSPDELLAGTSDWIKISAQAAFPGFDLDKDGSLSLVEFRLTMQANPELRWNEIILDPDGDGKISRKEFLYDRTVPLLRFVYFRMLDGNGDGELDPKEFVFKLRTPRAFYALNEDGTSWRRLFQIEEFPSVGSPAVSPDGKQIAFDGHRVKETLIQQALLVANLDGTNFRNLGQGLMPTWSPDGKQLTCSRYQPQSGLWILGSDGKNEQFLRDGWGAQWSPDGKQILFSDYRSIMTYEVASKTTTKIFDGAANGIQQIYWNMTWSPDGKRACFKGLKQPDIEVVATVSSGSSEAASSLWKDENTMTTKVISLDELQRGLRSVLESCAEPGTSFIIELPNDQRVSIQKWDEHDDLMNRLLENNAEFREMAKKSFEGPRRPFPVTTDSSS